MEENRNTQVKPWPRVVVPCVYKKLHVSWHDTNQQKQIMYDSPKGRCRIVDLYPKKQSSMIRGKTGDKLMDGDDEVWVFSNWRESTANGMFSWSGLHLESWAGYVLYINALNTAETVGMYAVLLRARSQVSPISWQSLSNILFTLSPGSLVPFRWPPFNC